MAVAISIIVYSNMSIAQIETVRSIELTENEKSEAISLARRFSIVLKTDNNIASRIDEFFVDNFARRWLDNGSLELADYISPKVASKVSEMEFRRFYVAKQEFYLIGVIYSADNTDFSCIKSDEPDPPLENMYPAGMFDEFKKDASLKKALESELESKNSPEFETVDFFRLHLKALESSVAVGKNYLTTRSSSQLKRYNKNIRYIEERDKVLRPSGKTFTYSRFNFSPGSRFIYVNIPFFELELVRVSGKFRIISIASYRG
jgi:hypothetical protein